MFKRLILEEWQIWMPIASFVLTAAAFLVFSARAVALKRNDTDALAHLPLEEDTEPREGDTNQTDKISE